MLATSASAGLIAPLAAALAGPMLTLAAALSDDCVAQHPGSLAPLRTTLRNALAALLTAHAPGDACDGVSARLLDTSLTVLTPRLGDMLSLGTQSAIVRRLLPLARIEVLQVATGAISVAAIGEGVPFTLSRRPEMASLSISGSVMRPGDHYAFPALYERVRRASAVRSAYTSLMQQQQPCAANPTTGGGVGGAENFIWFGRILRTYREGLVLQSPRDGGEIFLSISEIRHPIATSERYDYAELARFLDSCFAVYPGDLVTVCANPTEAAALLAHRQRTHTTAATSKHAMLLTSDRPNAIVTGILYQTLDLAGPRAVVRSLDSTFEAAYPLLHLVVHRSELAAALLPVRQPATADESTTSCSLLGVHEWAEAARQLNHKLHEPDESSYIGTLAAANGTTVRVIAKTHDSPTHYYAVNARRHPGPRDVELTNPLSPNNQWNMLTRISHAEIIRTRPLTNEPNTIQDSIQVAFNAARLSRYRAAPEIRALRCYGGFYTIVDGCPLEFATEADALACAETAQQMLEAALLALRLPTVE